MAINYPKPVERVIEELTKLPGIGPRSAERLVFHLLKAPRDNTVRLAQALVELGKKIVYCSICYNIAEKDPCPICADERREREVVCVVERPADVVAIERGGSYRGRYHLLMGKISPIDGVGPGALRLDELVKRVRAGGIKEVIIATGSDVEGEATALYCARALKPLGVKVTRIAHGIPMGSSLDFSDEVTISKALSGRVAV